MDNRPILFFDSGIGGLPYCRYFHVHNPGETLVYAADRENFPYGSKDRETLIGLSVSLIARIRKISPPKLAVVACNTATVSALDALRNRFPHLPFVGTVPAVKPAIRGSEKKHIGVLGTSRTIEDPYIKALVLRYGNGCAVTGIAAPELVEFVEYRADQADREERRRMVAPYIEAFRRAGADSVVLGCTHFLFLLDDFKRAGAPDMGIYDSVAGVSRRIEALLDEKKLRAPDRPEGMGPVNTLLITGAVPPEPSWLKHAAGFGLDLRRLDEVLPVSQAEAPSRSPGTP
jgi:glutamate racemase